MFKVRLCCLCSEQSGNRLWQFIAVFALVASVSAYGGGGGSGGGGYSSGGAGSGALSGGYSSGGGQGGQTIQAAVKVRCSFE